MQLTLTTPQIVNLIFKDVRYPLWKGLDDGWLITGIFVMRVGEKTRDRLKAAIAKKTKMPEIKVDRVPDIKSISPQYDKYRAASFDDIIQSPNELEFGTHEIQRVWCDQTRYLYNAKIVRTIIKEHKQYELQVSENSNYLSFFNSDREVLGFVQRITMQY